MTDSNVTLNDLRDATIIPEMGGTESWMIGFDEEDGEFGSVEYVPKNARNTLILKTDAAESGEVSVGSYDVLCDFEADTFRLNGPEQTITVPKRLEENALWAAYDEDEARLGDIYEDLTEDRVRVGVMDWFMPRFSAAREDDVLRKVKDGWLVNDEVLVNWQAENYAINVDETHIVNGSETVVADETKPARDYGFGNVPTACEMDSPVGPVELDSTELEFLATVEALLAENGYSVQNDVIGDLAEKASVNGFTDTKSGIHHGHTVYGKHDVSDLGVTDEAIEKLWSHSYDHTALHELFYREQEFKNAPFDVFDDAPNDDTDKWEKIHSTKEKAPIPSDTKAEFRSMFE